MNVMALVPVRPACACAASGPFVGSAAAAAGDHAGEELMTRRQVASMFGVTSATVATWARRGRLPEVRDEAGKPRYRREDVEALFRSVTRRGAR